MLRLINSSGIFLIVLWVIDLFLGGFRDII